MATLLVVNAGSSSLKLARFATGRDGLAQTDQREAPLTAEPGQVLEELLREMPGERPTAIAHRVVHGGRTRACATALSPPVMEEIVRATPLAPAHNRIALLCIDACAQRFATVPQYAAFDTSYFAQLPDVAATYALPPAISDEYGLRRGGYHGLSHQWAWRRSLEAGGGRRLLSLHLGAGCSAAAIVDGRPLDCSMAFSTLDGLVMATRSGDVDAGALLHLLRSGMPAQRLEALLARESGLLGVSGASSDLRRLLTTDTAAARLAIDLFCYRVRKCIGAYLAVLGGADVLSFGGGIGEHLPQIRSRILDGMQWAGIELDSAANARAVAGEARIGAPRGQVDIRVIPTNEARVIAEAALAIGACP